MTIESAFENVLADVQSEIISVSLEYAGPGVSDVFAYGSIENNTVQFDPFFIIEGKVVERHKVPGIDTSSARQKALLRYGVDQLQRLRSAGQEYGRPVPSQLKLHYVAATRTLDADYRYDPQYSNDPDLTTEDLVEQWQAEVQRTLEAGR